MIVIKNLPNDFSGLSKTTYLSRMMLNKLYGKELTDDEITDLVFSGKVEKRFSYYLPTKELLHDLKIIPNVIEIPEENFAEIAKRPSFVLKEIQFLFGNCNKDTAKVIAEKYFRKRYNYFYKTDELNELLMEGDTEISLA